MATTHLITEDPGFRALLPWAKAMAKAQHAPHLDVRHVLQAAHWQSRNGQLNLPQELVDRLATNLQDSPLPEPSQPVQDKMPLSDELKQALTTTVADGLHHWLEQLLEPPGNQGTDEADQASSLAGNSPEFHALKPWLAGAMRALNEPALSLKGVALAVHHAVAADALKDHVAFAHWCEGHADELASWLSHLDHELTTLAPVADVDFAIEPDDSFAAALAQHDPEECSPGALWKWVHAAINAANHSNRQLQVAYHEAGHAVALHVLSPEAIFSKITVTPEGNKGGYVASNANDAFNQIYLNSLEHAMETIVVALAGRAAEVRQFGESRSDSGAISDMQHATLTAWQAITAFGLDPEFGLLSLAAVQKIDTNNPHIAPMADSGWLQGLAQQRLHAWLRWGMQEATALVEACWPMVEALALELVEHKTLNNTQARETLGRWRADTPPYILRSLPAHS